MPVTVNNGRLTNHVAVVLDASYSMGHLTKAVIRTADELIKFLAEDSQKKDQETRVSVYTFSDNVTCHIWDMDVLRLPSMAEYYKIQDSTALIDATLTAIDDGNLIPETYGDHAHLVYVITDGEENVSKGRGPRPVFGRPPRDQVERELKTTLTSMKDNRTVAVLVPDDKGYRYASRLGFGNIALWDATSEAGLETAIETIKTATASYTSSRATGLRSTNNLFTLGADVDAKQVKKNLTPLKSSEYSLVPVSKTEKAFEKVIQKETKTRPEKKGWFLRIDDFINHVDPPFRIGKGYYQLFSGASRRREKIQGNKDIIVVDKKTSKAYAGAAARQVVGLPDHDVTVAPDTNPDFEIFVKSTSDNRHLPVGTKVLILT